jgi:hypothetical protein
MKASTIIVSALATLVAAAPTDIQKSEPRSAFDANLLSNFGGFASTNVNYVFGINGGAQQLALLQQLSLQQNLGLDQFAGLFNVGNGVFDIQSLLLMQQLNDLLAIAQLGVFGGFDLGGLNFGGVLNTGLLNLGGLDLNSFVQPNVVTQVQTVASQVFVVKE